MIKPILFNTNNLLTISAFILVLFLVSILVFSAKQLTNNTLEHTSQIIVSQYKKLHNLLNLHIHGQKRTIQLERIYLQEDPFEKDAALMDFYRDGGNYMIYRNQLALLVSDNPAETKWLEEMNALARVTSPIQERVAQLGMKGDEEKGRELLMNQALPRLEKFSQRVNEFSLFQAQEMKNLIADSKVRVDKLMHNIVTVAGLLILVSLAFAMMVTRKFNHINQQLKISNGTLEKEVRSRTQKLSQAREDLLHKNKILEQLSTTDPLTQLCNRLKIERVLEDLHQKYEDEQQIYSLLLIDIDCFKKVNDTYGHTVGDEVLKELSERLKQSFTQHGHIGRWGGEEFIVILENETLEQAVVAAETFRQKTENTSFIEVGNLTVSIGVATVTPTQTISELIHSADLGLYESKHAGRNRVTVYSNGDSA